MDEENLHQWRELPGGVWELDHKRQGWTCTVTLLKGMWQWRVFENGDSEPRHKGSAPSIKWAKQWAEKPWTRPGFHSAGTVGVVYDVHPSHERILDAAKQFAEEPPESNKGHWEAAVILAQTACEVIIARVMLAFAFADGRAKFDTYVRPPKVPGKRRPQLVKPLTGKDYAKQLKITAFDITDRKVRKLYTEMSGDEIAKQTWWYDLTRSVELRHEIIHGGAEATQQQARDAHQLATVLTTHLEHVRSTHPKLKWRELPGPVWERREPDRGLVATVTQLSGSWTWIVLDSRGDVVAEGKGASSPAEARAVADSALDGAGR